MTGFLQRATVSGGDSVVAALRQHVMGAADLVADAVASEQEDFVSRQQQAAQDDPQWSGLAQQMHSWEDPDGNFAHGVEGDDEAVTKAGLLEYGDLDHPPTAFLRMGVMTEVSNMRARLDSHFRRGGY